MFSLGNIVSTAQRTRILFFQDPAKVRQLGRWLDYFDSPNCLRRDAESKYPITASFEQSNSFLSSGTSL